jgi:two-component system sensor histidine kinase CpxA
MTFRFPLYAKILLWFFLNLVLLGVAFYIFVKVQFRLGLDSLLAGRAGDRIQAVGEVIMDEVNASPRGEWDEILGRFGNRFHVQFFLYRNDGVYLAGETSLLPPAVHERLSERRGPPPLLRDGSPERGPEGRPGPPGPFREPGLPGGPPSGRGKFILRTQDPVRYWVGLRVPILDRERPRPGPATLLVMSESLRGGGLFFDPTPWIIVAFGAVFFSVLFWIPLVRGMTRFLSRMTRATEQIAEGHFDTRVAAGRTDELGRLGAAIDHLAARLAGFVTGQKRFLGDTAHELCSPIARMQVALGILEERADEKQKPYVDDVREEVQHMSGLVNELLSFSKASLGAATIQLQAVSVRAIADEVIRREAAPEADLKVEVPEDLIVKAEPELLKRALANLVRNALRHAGHAGPITLGARRHEGRVMLTVSDAGPGVPEPHLAQLFDPFYRVDTARARETGGVGLGLTIVKSCVEACGGTVTCRNLKPTGFAAEITLATP